jgi:hypothetical protein
MSPLALSGRCDRLGWAGNFKDANLAVEFESLDAGPVRYRATGDLRALNRARRFEA